MNKGRFITFEGGEGAGKSTLIDSLFLALKTRGHAVLKTREPGGTKIGHKIRNLVLDPENKELVSKAELFLYLADRAQHVEEVILPELAKGTFILCDRYNDSTYAYQAVGRGLAEEIVRPFAEFAVGGLVPDKTFYLDIDPEEGLRRVRGQFEGKKDRIELEHVDFHRKIREAFLAFAAKEPGRFTVLDARKSKEIILQEAIDALF